MTSPPPPRFLTLDVLRGVAVMGILLLNIQGFALPEGAYFNPAAYGGRGVADQVTWAVATVLFDGKMRALFSILFGASMMLIDERAVAAGRSGVATHYVRMAWLLLFGLAHDMLWRGDILAHYALVGAVAYPFRRMPPEKLLAAGLCLMLAQGAIGVSTVIALSQLQAAAAVPGAAPRLVRAWLDLRGTIGVPDAATLAQQLALYRGSFGGIVADHFGHRGEILSFLTVGGPETLALMLFGMAGYKSGFLTGHWDRAVYGRVAAYAYLIALPIQLIVTAVAIHSGYDSLTTFGASFAAGTPLRPAIALGHAALLLWWLAGPRGAWAERLMARIAAAGRAAFSNYLGTTLMMVFVFQGWGLGLFGRVDRAALLLPVIAAWALMLAWSKPWLARYRYGPFEWLWRSLARARAQPMRRMPNSDIAT